MSLNISRNKIKTIRENIKTVKNGDVANVSLLLSELESELNILSHYTIT